MYKLLFLPVARQDMVDVAAYVSRVHANPEAAVSLAEIMVQAVNQLTQFPYAHPVYIPIRPLKQEYRKLIVRNYLVLYWVDEEAGSVTIARVLYVKRDYEKVLHETLTGQPPFQQ